MTLWIHDTKVEAGYDQMWLDELAGDRIYWEAIAAGDERRLDRFLLWAAIFGDTYS